MTLEGVVPKTLIGKVQDKMGMNILIVEDSSVMRSMIAKTVQLSGVDIGDIYQAANGREGLECLDRQRVDLVIADINMPVMNGEDMIDEMLAHPEHRHLPIMVISTEGSQTRIERLRQKGAVFLQKPFSPEKVRDVLKQMLGEEAFDGSVNRENTFDSGA
jgi:two-component system chemotaxis response regulator CheY